MQMETNKKQILNSSIPTVIDSSFLERTIEILVINDEACILDLYSEYLSLYKLYNVRKTFGVKEAKPILSSDVRIHVCIIDVGLMDINNDEYNLIKEFSEKTSFIIVTGKGSQEAGFKARIGGAYAVIMKPVNFVNLSIINEINNAFLQSAIKKAAFDNSKPVSIDAVKVFTGNKPMELKPWIKMVNIDERRLREIWAEFFRFQPSYLFVLQNLFVTAFEYYTHLYCKELRLENGPHGEQPNDFEYVNRRLGAAY